MPYASRYFHMLSSRRGLGLSYRMIEDITLSVRVLMFITLTVASEFSGLLHYRLRYNIISQSSQVYYVIGCVIALFRFITLSVEIYHYQLEVYYITC